MVLALRRKRKTTLGGGLTATLVDRLETITADCSETMAILDSERVIEELPWAQVYQNARERAGHMQALGISPGDRIAVLGFTSREMLETILAIPLCGAAIVILPLPMRLASHSAFIEQTQSRLAASGASLLVIDAFFASQYEPGPDDPQTVPMADLSASSNKLEDVKVSPRDLAVLQFTSGSTAAPRAVRLSHAAICSNLASIHDALSHENDDKVLSWLPLYHDMGLIGGLFFPATSALPVSISAPQAFLSRPAMWMEAMSERKATITCAPNFAYALAARALRRATELDLSSIRIAVCGAEPVSISTFENFIDAATPFGFRPTSVLPVYGLAEATLAVTFPSPLDELHTDDVDRSVLEDDRAAVPTDSSNAKRLVALGRPLRGVALRVVDESGADLGDREVGEILIAGAGLMDGYDRHPRETELALRNGWLHTGDLGYLVDGELFVCGRKKDLIIVGGRNIWPEDVEEAAQRVSGVRAGNAIAFSIDKTSGAGSEALVLIAETKQTPDEARMTATTVATTVKDHVGLAPRQVLLLEPGTLPKTSSGKVQRNLCRQQYLDGQIVPIAAHGASS